MPVKFKKGSKEAKAHMAKIRAMRGSGAGKHTDTKSHNVNIKVVSGTKKKSATRQTGTSVKSKDKLRSALPPGKRTTGKGKAKHTYTERRANRSDKPGSLTGINKGDISLNDIGAELYNLDIKIISLKNKKKQSKTISEKKKIQEQITVYNNQFKTLRAYLNTRAKFI